MDGSATFTTVLSSMIMNRAKHIATSVHQRRLSSVSARRCAWARTRSVIGHPSRPGGRRRPRAGRAAGPGRRPGDGARPGSSSRRTARAGPGRTRMLALEQQLLAWKQVLRLRATFVKPRPGCGPPAGLGLEQLVLRARALRADGDRRGPDVPVAHLDLIGALGDVELERP